MSQRSEPAAADTRGQRLARYRALRTRNDPRTSMAAFKALVTAALDDLPPWVQARVENVAFVVEEEASRARLLQLGYDPNYGLLGLYEGIARPLRGGGYHGVMPDRITLFRRPILQEVGPAASAEAIRQEVRQTVVHEVAHHFGIDDAELELLEGRPRHVHRAG